MSKDIVTSDLSEFGFIELHEASKLLDEWSKNALPDQFELDDVKLFMNKNSGFVFLSNSNFEVVLMNGDQAEMFYSCPECGEEGFAEDINWNADECRCGECAKEILLDVRGIIEQ